MDIQLKKRIVGIALLLALGLLLAPLFLTRSLPVNELQLSAKIPTPPEKPSTLLAALPGETVTIPAIAHSTVSLPADADSVKSGSRIAFEQDDSDLPNTVQDDAVVQPTATNQAQTPITATSGSTNATQSTPTPAPVTMASSAAATSLTQEKIQPVSSAPQPKITPTSPVKIQSNAIPNAYVVQLGSFSAKINAEKMVKQLQSKGFPAYLRTTKTAKGVWVRVLVGPQLRRSDAEKQLQKLNELFETKGMIVKANP